MTEIRMLAATGMLGSGFPATSLKRAMSLSPHFIGCDSGSSDFGPHPLGSGKSPMPKDAWKRDMRLILHAGRTAGVPVLIGSTGGAGADAHLSWGREIVEEIAREDDLHFRLAMIHAEQDAAYIARCLDDGRLQALPAAPDVSPDDVRQFDHIVALMGVEPYQAALGQGAEVILAGRSTDTAIFAAIPLMYQTDPGLAWHAAKLLECGAAPVEHRTRPDCFMGFVRDSEIIVQAPNPDLRCTPLSVAAHSLYENADPFHLLEPSGMLDTSETEYAQMPDGRSVKISGSRFAQADEYTVKLEASRLAGYQAIAIAGVRDRAVLKDFEYFRKVCLTQIQARLDDLFTGDIQLGRDCQFRYLSYGIDGIMGSLEPSPVLDGHELGLILEGTAPTQELADILVSLAEYITMHNPVRHWEGFTTNLAFPYVPAHFRRGPVYQFGLNHVLPLSDALAPFPIDFVDL